MKKLTKKPIDIFKAAKTTVDLIKAFRTNLNIKLMIREVRERFASLIPVSAKSRG